MAKKDSDDQFNIVLDHVLHEKFKKYCKLMERSKNKQIVFLIKKALDEWEEQNKNDNE